MSNHEQIVVAEKVDLILTELRQAGFTIFGTVYDGTRGHFNVTGKTPDAQIPADIKQRFGVTLELVGSRINWSL